MAKVKCTNKNRNYNGVIQSYELMDENGNIQNFTHDQVKSMLNSKEYDFTNLQIDKAGRIVDKAVENFDAKANDILCKAFDKCYKNLENKQCLGFGQEIIKGERINTAPDAIKVAIQKLEKSGYNIDNLNFESIANMFSRYITTKYKVRVLELKIHTVDFTMICYGIDSVYFTIADHINIEDKINVYTDSKSYEVTGGYAGNPNIKPMHINGIEAGDKIKVKLPENAIEYSVVKNVPFLISTYGTAHTKKGDKPNSIIEFNLETSLSSQDYIIEPNKTKGKNTKTTEQSKSKQPVEEINTKKITTPVHMVLRTMRMFKRMK